MNIATAAERTRRENTWVLVLNRSSPNGPMNQREDYHEAIKIKERFFEESGNGNTRLHPSEQARQRQGQPFAWHDGGSERVDPKTYNLNPSASSSSSGWRPSSWWPSSSWSHRRLVGVNDIFLLFPESRRFAYKQWRFPCKRRRV